MSWVWHETASDGEAPVQKIMRVLSTSSLLLISYPLLHRLVVSVRVQDMGQIGLFKKSSYLIGPCAKKKNKMKKLIQLQKKNGNINIQRLFVCLFGFYGISTFVGYLMPNPFLFKKIVPFQFTISTQFNCQKHFYFKLFNFVKQFYFEQFSIQKQLYFKQFRLIVWVLWYINLCWFI